MVAGAEVGTCGSPDATNKVTCFVGFGKTIAAGTPVLVTLNGLTNPVQGSQSLSLATTSDPSAQPGGYLVGAAHAITTPAVSIADPTAAAGARTVYSIGFTTSSSGKLSYAANSEIYLTFPTGTGFSPGYDDSSIMAGGDEVGVCGSPDANRKVTCFIGFGQSIAPNTPVTVILNGITNAAEGARSVAVSTTSDPAPQQGAYTVGAAHPITNLAVRVGTTAASAPTKYTITFNASSTGAFSYEANSEIRLAFPAGTTFGAAYTDGGVFVGETRIGDCGGATGTTLICRPRFAQAIPAGAAVRLTLTNITNPATGAPWNLTASTTSDPQSVASSAYTVAGPPDTTVLSGPSGTTSDATPTFTYSSDDPDATFECRVDSALFAACGAEYTAPQLTDGPHTFEVRAIGADGVDPSPAARSFTVATVAPDTSITGGPSGTTGDLTPTFAFTATEPGATFECRVDAAAFTSCTSPFTTGSLAAGPHTFDVRATGVSGTDQTPASRSFTVAIATTTIDSAPAGPTSAPSFMFSADPPGAAFECSVDSAPFAACTSPYSPAGLSDGVHTFAVRAVGGQAVQRSFTVATPQQQQPTPTPTPIPTPSPTPTPTPVPGKSVVVQPVSGKVLVKRPGTNGFVEVDASQGIPLGSTVDTRNGVVELTAKAGQTAKFYDGIFKITQSGGTTNLTLNEPLAHCRGARAAKKKPKTRKLWGDGSGSFRTRGHYSAATVRGTKWLVQDSCAGTLTKVAKGVVSVRDNVKGKTILLKAGKRYLAKPRR